MSEKNTTDRVEELCRDVYADTRARYQKFVPLMGERALGYKIFYGPLTINAPILFIGSQPGGGLADAIEGEAWGERDQWPSRCEYAYRSWKLATNMRGIWRADFLERCTGLNANFFRAPCEQEWNLLPASLRREASKFCSERISEIVEALHPQHVVVIGLGPFDRLTGFTGTLALSQNGRSLVRIANHWRRHVHGVIHLSGAHISTNALTAIRAYFDNLISN
jgi:hypothetical protein